MTTAYHGDAELKLAALEAIFEQSLLAEPVGRGILPAAALTPSLPPAAGPTISAPPPGIELDDLLMEAEDGSIPQPEAVRCAFWRSFWTLAPLVLSDAAALAAAGSIAQGVLWFAYPPAAVAVGWFTPLLLLPLMIAYWFGDLYCEIWVHAVVELRQLSRFTTVGLLAACAGAAVAWPCPIWFAIVWPLAICLVPLCRCVVRSACAESGWWGYATLVIGSGEGASSVARALLDTPRSGLRPVLMSDPSGRCRSSVLPVVNHLPTLESIVRTRGIRHAVVSLPDISGAELTVRLDGYAQLAPHLLVLSDCTTLPCLWAASRSCGRLSGMEVRNGLMLFTLRCLKRLIDLSIAVTAICLSFPLLLLIAAVIVLTSRGPALYRHTRVGWHGYKFKAWKFRTMRRDADAYLRHYLDCHPEARAEWERDRKLRRDPRVTAFGHFLRRTSLDELPQLWNVLVGDMSLVGPRPIVEEEVPRYAKAFRQYATVKPGITGLWQVSGRTETGYEDRVRLDQFYVRHWSPWLDVYILAKTIVTLLTRDGAY
jgi:Undecaprenyl-phosphate galactose phosphotransferase WbaP